MNTIKRYQVISECIDADGIRKFPSDSLELDDEQYARAKKSGVVGAEVVQGGKKTRKAGDVDAQVKTGESSTSGAGDVK